MESLETRLARLEARLPVQSFVYCTITANDFTVGQDIYPRGDQSIDEIRKFLKKTYSRPGIQTHYVYIWFPEMIVKVDSPGPKL